MKKLMSQILFILLIIIIGMASTFTTKVDAASIAGIAVSAAKVGKNFTVSLILPAEAFGAECTVTVTFSDGTQSSQRLVYMKGLESSGFPNGVDFAATVPGNATINVTNIVISDENSNFIENGGTKQQNITIEGNSQTSGGSNSGSSSSSGTGTGTSNPSSNSGTTNPPTTNTTNKNNNTTTDNNTVTKEPEVVNPTFKDVNETVYALKSCNVRSSCSTSISSNKIGSLNIGQAVKRTGVESNWSRIEYNGKTAYVATYLLTTEKPEEKTQNETEIENTVSEENRVTNENLNEVINELENSQNDILKNIQSEVGVLPEVGDNIAVKMFYIITTITLVTILIVNYKLRKESL